MATTPNPLDDTRAFTPALALREVGLSLLLLLLCLLGVEALLRSEAVYSRLPLPRAYYSYDVTRRLQYVDRLRQNGPIDVLFLGSSIVRANIDPEQFDAVLRQRGHAVRSFNAGLSSLFAPAGKLYLEHVWLDAAEPRYVLYGVREAELKLGNKSSRSRYLTKGAIESKWLEGTRWSLLQARALQHLQLAQYRGTLRKLIERYREGIPWHIREASEMATNERGHRPERTPLATKRRHKSKRLWKYHGAPRSSRYRNSLPALEVMHKLCAEAGATFVLVNVPEHPDRYGHADGPAIWTDYQQRIRAWADAHGVAFVDVTQGNLHAFANDAYYSDYHHLSPHGAKLFSTLLAEQFSRLLAKPQP